MSPSHDDVTFIYLFFSVLILDPADSLWSPFIDLLL